MCENDIIINKNIKYYNTGRQQYIYSCMYTYQCMSICIHKPSKMAHFVSKCYKEDYLSVYMWSTLVAINMQWSTQNKMTWWALSRSQVFINVNNQIVVESCGKWITPGWTSRTLLMHLLHQSSSAAFHHPENEDILPFPSFRNGKP